MSTPSNPNRTPRGAARRTTPPPAAPTPSLADDTTPTPSTPTPPAPRRSSSGGFAGRYTSTVILGGVFLVLALALFFLTQNPQAGVINPTPTPTPAPVVWDLSASTAQAIRVDSITQTVAVQIVNNQWQLTAPTNEPASQFQVGTLADQLKKIQAQRTLTETDLTKYGLDSPVLTVTLVVSGATQTDNTLLVGKTTIDGGSYYVKAKDKPTIYVVLNSLIEQLRAWINVPPKAEPTPTPLVIITPSPTPSITPTPGVAGPVRPTDTAAVAATPTTAAAPAAATPTTAAAATPTH
jgi:hypothetical protein